MTPEEHIAESKDSILTAERLYHENRPLQGAEIMWCSVKHAINAVGVRRGWRYGTYGQKRGIIIRLEAEGHSDLLDLLSAARRLHTDSDHGVLRVQEIAAHRSASVTLVERLLSIAELG